MSTSASDPVPQRIGDAERDQAVGYLRDHLATGRLDQSEFEDRLTRALTAKTAADLDPLFRDLPSPRPGIPLPTVQPPPWEGTVAPATASGPAAVRPQRAGKVLNIVTAAVWPLVIMTCFIVGWEYWWLIFIPIALSSIAGSLSAKPPTQRGDLEQ